MNRSSGILASHAPARNAAYVSGSSHIKRGVPGGLGASTGRTGLGSVTTVGAALSAALGGLRTKSSGVLRFPTKPPNRDDGARDSEMMAPGIPG